jgi:hypothetical protein
MKRIPGFTSPYVVNFFFLLGSLLAFPLCFTWLYYRGASRVADPPRQYYICALFYLLLGLYFSLLGFTTGDLLAVKRIGGAQRGACSLLGFTTGDLLAVKRFFLIGA